MTLHNAPLLSSCACSYKHAFSLREEYNQRKSTMSSQNCSLQLSLLLVAAHVREFFMRLHSFFAFFTQENLTVSLWADGISLLQKKKWLAIREEDIPHRTTKRKMRRRLPSPLFRAMFSWCVFSFFAQKVNLPISFFSFCNIRDVQIAHLSHVILSRSHFCAKKKVWPLRS